MDFSLKKVESAAVALTAQVRTSSKPAKIFGICLALYAIRNLYYRMKRKFYNFPPGPVGFPFFGNLFSALDTPKYAAYLASNYGSITMIYIGTQPFVFLHSIDTINEVMTNDGAMDRNSFHESYSFSHCNESEMGIAAANEKYWLAKRRHFQAILLSSVNSSYLDDVHSKSLTSHVFASIDNCIINGDLWHFSNDVSYIASHSIWCACFGTFLEYGSSEAEKAIIFPRRILIDSAVDILILNLNLSNILPDFIVKRVFTAPREFDAFLMTCLNKHLGYDETVFDVDEHKWDAHFEKVREDMNACGASKIIASHRTKGNNVFTSMRAIIQSLSTFFFAGADSTFHTFEYALVLLAKNPVIQQRIYEEIQNIFKDSKYNEETCVVVDIAVINKLNLLRAFFHEVYRISCVGPLGVAHYNRNSEIEVVSGKYSNGDAFVCRIPKGSMILTDIPSANKRDIYWKQQCNGRTSELCLDNWLVDNGIFKGNLHKNKMLAFGVGARDCIGRSLVFKSSYVLFCKLMMRYEFRLPDGISNDVEIKQVYNFNNVMKPKIPLRVVRR